MFSRKFAAICNDHRNTTGSEIPIGIQRTSLLGALRTRDIDDPGGVTLTARAPGAFTPLYQSLMPQKLNINEMLRMLEATCESILSTDPTALTHAKDSSTLALVSSGHGICTSYKGIGRAPKHTNRQHNERTKYVG